MKISEARLKELQARGALVKRAPKPVVEETPLPADERLEVQRNQLAAQLAQSVHLAEIVTVLREQNEYRNERVRLKVNRKNGLIDTIDIERL
jgi:hypothetical protein